MVLVSKKVHYSATKYLCSSELCQYMSVALDNLKINTFKIRSLQEETLVSKLPLFT